MSQRIRQSIPPKAPTSSDTRILRMKKGKRHRRFFIFRAGERRPAALGRFRSNAYHFPCVDYRRVAQRKINPFGLVPKSPRKTIVRWKRKRIPRREQAQPHPERFADAACSGSGSGSTLYACAGQGRPFQRAGNHRQRSPPSLLNWPRALCSETMAHFLLHRTLDRSLINRCSHTMPYEH